MKPCLRNRRVAKVLATKSWEATLKHRVYSCPNAPEYNSSLDATCLILENQSSNARVPLEVVPMITHALGNEEQLDHLAMPFRTKLQNYKEAVQIIPRILEVGVTHRFYFLSDEPWPDWIQRITASASETEWAAILSVCTEPERFFEWPQTGTLLWPGCTRGNEDQRHQYPDEIATRLANLGLQLDPRNNGPAIMAFLAAGGIRPVWGREGWPIHHIYERTEKLLNYPQEVTHADSHGQHFTHSAGLVAAHPVVHHLAHQSKLLKWLLRREAFLRFGYDPMHVFSDP